jgi:hypothetical protein
VSDDLLVILMHGAAIRSWNYALYCGVIAAGISVLVMLLTGLLAKRTPAAEEVVPSDTRPHDASGIRSKHRQPSATAGFWTVDLRCRVNASHR